MVVARCDVVQYRVAVAEVTVLRSGGEEVLVSSGGECGGDICTTHVLRQEMCAVGHAVAGGGEVSSGIDERMFSHGLM